MAPLFCFFSVSFLSLPLYFSELMKNAAPALITLAYVAMLLAQVPTSGLQAYYSFNGSTANDSTGRTLNDGKLFLSNPTPFVVDRTGKGLAANFDGVDDFILIPNRSVFNLPRDSAVLSVWFDADACTRIGTGPHALWDMFELSNTGKRRQITLFLTDERDSAGNLFRLVEAVACVSNNTDTEMLVLPFRIYSSGWHFAAVSWEKPDLRLYVDEAPVEKITATIADAKMSTNNRTTYFGSDIFTGAKCFCGQLDDIRLYNQALSDSEVTLLAKENSTNAIRLRPGQHSSPLTRITVLGANGSGEVSFRVNTPSVKNLRSLEIFAASGKRLDCVSWKDQGNGSVFCTVHGALRIGCIYILRLTMSSGCITSIPVVFLR
jgi:hypothetical protein